MDTPFLLGFVFLVLGLSTLHWNAQRRKLAELARNWPVTNARVCVSRVSYARPKTDDSDCLEFFYKYEVDGVSHIGNSLDLFKFEGGTVDEMEEIVKTYPHGAQVQVYYDANDPSVSVVDPGHRLGYMRNRNFGVLLTTFGVLVLGAVAFW